MLLAETVIELSACNQYPELLNIKGRKDDAFTGNHPGSECRFWTLAFDVVQDYLRKNRE